MCSHCSVSERAHCVLHVHRCYFICLARLLFQRLLYQTSLMYDVLRMSLMISYYYSCASWPIDSTIMALSRCDRTHASFPAQIREPDVLFARSGHRFDAAPIWHGAPLGGLPRVHRQRAGSHGVRWEATVLSLWRGRVWTTAAGCAGGRLSSFLYSL